MNPFGNTNSYINISCRNKELVWNYPGGEVGIWNERQNISHSEQSSCPWGTYSGINTVDGESTTGGEKHVLSRRLPGNTFLITCIDHYFLLVLIIFLPI